MQPADDDTRRAEAVHALDRLGNQLVARLDFEKASLTPILRQIGDWPW